MERKYSCFCAVKVLLITSYVVLVTAMAVDAATISGQITNDSGDGLSNVCVNAHGSDCGFEGLGGAVTDANGNFTIDITGGTYFIQTDVSCGGSNSSTYIDKFYNSSGGTVNCFEADGVGTGSSGISLTLEQGGSISGTLQDSSGSAITGIDLIGVTVYQGSCDNLQWVGWGEVDSTTGLYSTSGIPAGEYILETNMQGTSYVNKFWTGSGGVPDCVDAESVTVTAGVASSGKDFQLDQGGVVSGTLRDSSGVPITGFDFIGVTIFQGSCDNLQQVSGAGVDSGTGNYSTPGLPAGEYIIQANMQGTSYTNEYWASAGSVADCADTETILVTAGATITGKDFQLDQGAVISGTLRDSSGTPITGLDSISITVFQGSCDEMQWVSWGPVDPGTGTYNTFDGLPAGEYLVQTNMQGSSYIDKFWASSGGGVVDCADAEPITVTAGETITGKDFQLDQGGMISGVLHDSSGTPITGFDFINVGVFQGSCDNLQWVGQGSIDSATGSYSTTGLPAGDYIVQANMGGTSYIDEYWASGGSVIDCADAETVTVTAGSTITGKDFQLDQGGVISGTVFQGDGITPVTGTQICVDVYKNDPCDGGSWERVGGDCIDSADGTYTTGGLVAGEYFLFTNTFGSDYISEYWASGASTNDCSGAEMITVAAGQASSSKNFQLDVGGAIAGTVYQADGVTPVTGTTICVDVFKNDPCDGGIWAGSDCTGSVDGTYEIGGLPAGNYYLSTNTFGSGYIEEYWADPASVQECAGAQAVTVNAGETSGGKDFQLDMGGTITGTVYDQVSGLPLTNHSETRINFYTGDPCGYFDYEGGVNIENDGTFTIPGVKDGVWYVRASTNNDYVDEWSTGTSSDESCSAATLIDMTNGVDISNLDFYLESGARISGHVYEGDGTTPIDSDRELRVQVFQGNPCGDMSWFTNAKTFGADGSYQTGALPAGTFFLRFQEEGRDASDDIHQREWWADPLSTPECSGAQEVVVSGTTDITGKDFQIDKTKKPFPWAKFLAGLLIRNARQ